MTDAPIRVNDPEFQRRQRRRNLAMLAALFALVALFYAITLVQLTGAKS